MMHQLSYQAITADHSLAFHDATKRDIHYPTCCTKCTELAIYT